MTLAEKIDFMIEHRKEQSAAASREEAKWSDTAADLREMLKKAEDDCYFWGTKVNDARYAIRDLEMLKDRIKEFEDFDPDTFEP